MCLYACVYVKLMPENKLYKEIWSTTYLNQQQGTRKEYMPLLTTLCKFYLGLCN